MAITHAPLTLAESPPAIDVRKITSEDLRRSLSDGWSDFLAMRGDLIFLGLLYPLVGFVAAFITMGGSMLPLFFPIASGIALLGPLVAIGFYELARRREQGLESDWSHFFDFAKRPSAAGLFAVGTLLVTIFAAWIIAAALLFMWLWGGDVWLFGGEAPMTIGQFVTRLFTTSEGWALIVAGNAIGACFALLVLAVSVVSLPMLVDCTVDARTALSTSVRAFSENKGVMIQWGVTIAVLLVLGSIPLFIGLAVVLPVLGYATWHLYERVVDRKALDICHD